ncbi:hypothetical protein ScPMuIL_007290, partial [Solemya velum]
DQAIELQIHTCDSHSQSPIDIPQTLVYDPTHVAVSGDAFIEGGGLPSRYKLVPVPFHWGNNSSVGSEHTIYGHQFMMEVHFVHYNVEYSGIEEAMKEPDGLAVLGFMFQVSVDPNPGLSPIVDKLQDVQSEGSSSYIDSGTMALSDILPESFGPFFRYTGSLSTPPCYESVIWTLFTDFIHISESQMNEFRKLTHTEGERLVDNFRPYKN